MVLAKGFYDSDWPVDIERLKSELTALKLAATEQATQAEAVLNFRTREFERKEKELCQTIHDLTRERDALALSQGRLLGALKDAPTSQSADFAPRYRIWCKQARAAIAEATPEGETK